MAIKVSTTTVIDNSRNVVNVGNVGDSNTTYYGDGSNLSGVGGSGNVFVASGTIPNGATVSINDDGTVSRITGDLTSENYIGIASESISDGATGDITTRGEVNSEQSGLTIARTYYVQSDGSLALTPDDPSVVAGTSISSTKILVR